MGWRSFRPRAHSGSRWDPEAHDRLSEPQYACPASTETGIEVGNRPLPFCLGTRSEDAQREYALLHRHHPVSLRDVPTFIQNREAHQPPSHRDLPPTGDIQRAIAKFAT
jgi:hypothetical protein